MAERVDQLVELVRAAQARGIAWRVLGSGSNVLVSEAGIRGLVIVNKAKKIVFEGTQVTAEAGANLSSLARNCIARGLGGLEWAVSVPGTVGGAVIGNAGAHGADIAQSLTSIEILVHDGTTEHWAVERLEYGYRDSSLKRTEHRARPVVLAATFTLETADPHKLTKRADGFVARRKATQPPGASVGSMFKNPPGDYAGRLIEQAGLKGRQIGDAQISPVHANFFLNMGNASADDVKALIDLAREQVQQRFGVELELEIELIGEW
jgi:UDP-N-acetylmuramate dehydrogenase